MTRSGTSLPPRPRSIASPLSFAALFVFRLRSLSLSPLFHRQPPSNNSSLFTELCLSNRSRNATRARKRRKIYTLVTRPARVVKQRETTHRVTRRSPLPVHPALASLLADPLSLGPRLLSRNYSAFDGAERGGMRSINQRRDSKSIFARNRKHRGVIDREEIQ